MSLPAVIQEIVRAIGHGKTMLLVKEFGGQEITVPKTENSATWAALAEVIGERAMEKLAVAFSDAGPLYIAKCAQAMRDDRNRAMVSRYEKLLKDGHSCRGAVSILVRDHGLCNRAVENIVNSPLPEPGGLEKQACLF